MDETPEQGADPNFDPKLAQELVGKRVLVGLTQLTNSGRVRHSYQLHGVVMQVDPDKGIMIALEGVRAGGTWTMPPATAAFSRASPGVYALKETGEEVVDPDFLAVWTVKEPPGRPEDSERSAGAKP